MSFCGLAGAFGLISAVELWVRRHNLKIDVFALEICEHIFADDVVADVVAKVYCQFGEFGCIFVVQFVVFSDKVGVGRILGQCDYMNEVEAWDGCN